jgi:hypothetical protein
MKQALKIGCGVFLGIMFVIVTMLACIAGIDAILLNNENNHVSELEATPIRTIAVGWKRSTEVPYEGDGTPDPTLGIMHEVETKVAQEKAFDAECDRQATISAMVRATLEANK